MIPWKRARYRDQESGRKPTLQLVVSSLRRRLLAAVSGGGFWRRLLAAAPAAASGGGSGGGFSPKNSNRRPSLLIRLLINDRHNCCPRVPFLSLFGHFPFSDAIASFYTKKKAFSSSAGGDGSGCC